MQFIKGVTFGAFCHKGSLETKEAYESLDNLKENKSNARNIEKILYDRAKAKSKHNKLFGVEGLRLEFKAIKLILGFMDEYDCNISKISSIAIKLHCSNALYPGIIVYSIAPSVFGGIWFSISFTIPKIFLGSACPQIPNLFFLS